MNQRTAWEILIDALRRKFIQGNSQCENIDDFIESQTIELIEKIRSSKQDTAKAVKRYSDSSRESARETRS